MNRLQVLCIGLAGATIAAASAASATATLGGTLTADNQFEAFISTSSTSIGDEVDSGTNWQSPQSFSGYALTYGKTYYMNVVAWNYSNSDTPDPITPANDPYNPDMLGGTLTLTGGHFVGGGDTLSTSTAWNSSIVPSGSTSYDTSNWLTPTSAVGTVPFGDNGVAQPWAGINGAFPGISNNAQLIWGSNPAGDSGESFFSVSFSAVPEPGVWALMLIGFGGMGVALRRSRRLRPAVAAA